MKLDLQEDIFVNMLCNDLVTPGVRPVDVVERAISELLTDSLKKEPPCQFRISPKMHIFPHYNKNRCPTLPDLVRSGYKTWYSEIRFSADHEASFPDLQIEARGITLDDIAFGRGVRRAFQLKSKKLKTRTNHILRLNTLRIEGRIFSRVLDKLCNVTLEQPYIANPNAWLNDYGDTNFTPVFKFVSFDHMLTGQRTYCECAKPAYDLIYKRAIEEVPSFAPNSWPHQVIKMFEKAHYVAETCHLCIAKRDGPEAAAAKYGDYLYEYLDAYKELLVVIENLDERTARAEIQQRLNLSRWVQEAELYKLIKQIFPDELVFREASPPWLGRQRLDIYIPRLSMAIEYQGLQHYEAVEVFGGEEAFKRTVERDKLKQKLCEDNQVDLIQIKYSDTLTLTNMRQRFRRYLKSS